MSGLWVLGCLCCCDWGTQCGQGTFEQRVQETSNLGVQDKVSCGQGHLNVDSRARMGVHKFI